MGGVLRFWPTFKDDPLAQTEQLKSEKTRGRKTWDLFHNKGWPDGKNVLKKLRGATSENRSTVAGPAQGN